MYPFGLKHKGYNNVVSSNGNSTAQKFGYNGVELEESLGLNLYEMDVRSYDPAIARFTSIDPVTHHSMSTYTAFDNNPIYWADPSGANAEWIPQVDKNGNINYVAEQGDSAQTLSQQFGISQETAEEITGTTGDTEITEGTEVSGETVEGVTGSEVLSLDLNSEQATDSRVIQQFVFANDYTKSQGDFGWYATSFYGNLFKQLQLPNTYNGEIKLGGAKLNAELVTDWYTSGGVPFIKETKHSIYFSTGSQYSEDRTGTFGGKPQTFTNLRIPRGYAFDNPPTIRSGDGIQLKVEKQNGNTLINHFNK